MKAISLWQPWASAIAVGLKENETRHWPTPYRGPLAIHAAQKHDRSLARFFASMMDQGSMADAFRRANILSYVDLPRGAIVAVCELWDCISTDVKPALSLSRDELFLGNYSEHRFAWCLRNVRPLKEPYFIVGHQGFFEVPDNVTNLC